MAPTNQIEELQKQFSTQLSTISTLSDLEKVRTEFLGRNGLVNTFFKNLPQEQKKNYGAALNELKKNIESTLSDKTTLLQQKETEQDFDVTVPGILPPIGHLHLITQAIKEIEEIFGRIGFVRRRYPEIDTDWYAAEGLNIPKDHPARDDQETFYVKDNIVLTPHTSNGQLREMERKEGFPIKMINIGKTYRRQIDVSHTPMFHQFEGLMIDKDINITHLIGISNYFVQSYFGPKRQIRLRPHHFQFTEPSFEVDITCGVCNGAGCRLCKAGWLELGGAGMVHPNVIKNGGLDPHKYTGFAFGWGVERVLMMKSGLNLGDIRNIYSPDLRLLNQF